MKRKKEKYLNLSTSHCSSSGRWTLKKSCLCHSQLLLTAPLWLWLHQSVVSKRHYQFYNKAHHLSSWTHHLYTTTRMYKSNLITHLITIDCSSKRKKAHQVAADADMSHTWSIRDGKLLILLASQSRCVCRRIHICHIWCWRVAHSRACRRSCRLSRNTYYSRRGSGHIPGSGDMLNAIRGPVLLEECTDRWFADRNPHSTMFLFYLSYLGTNIGGLDGEERERVSCCCFGGVSLFGVVLCVSAETASTGFVALVFFFSSLSRFFFRILLNHVQFN